MGQSQQQQKGLLLLCSILCAWPGLSLSQCHNKKTFQGLCEDRESAFLQSEWTSEWNHSREDRGAILGSGIISKNDLGRII